ncbi:MAG: response regulator [Cyanobacteriota bacterium]|nr:response regulator [Cyanobacteriota bacterium]
MAAKTVLVIDDSIMIRKMVASILADQFEVLEAKDGLVGLDTAKKHHPDLILLDFVMPKMDGYETLQALRKEDDLRNTPVVMMSGLREQVTARIPEPFVGFDFIEKPFEASALVEQIQKALQVSPQPEVDLSSEPMIQQLLSKMSTLETLFIQGTETMVQREVVSRLNNLNERVKQQEGVSHNLQTYMEKILAEIDRQNKGLALIANELRQIRKRLG